MLYISLNLTPTIDAAQWDRFWCESLELLQKFPLRLVRNTEHKLPYGLQKVWTDKITVTNQNGESWEITGDAESLVFGHPIRLYRDFELYRERWNQKKSKYRSTHEDPLFCEAKDFKEADDDVPLGGIPIFNKFMETQGYPYHHAAVAVAMLAEHRFPGQSLAWGDLRPEGCQGVRDWISFVLKENVQLPICLDADRLWNRIQSVCGDGKTTMKRFEERFLGTTAQEIQKTLAEVPEITMRRLAMDLVRQDSVTIGFQHICRAFLEATGDLEKFLDLLELRNSLAVSKKGKERKKKVVPFEKVLKMLVNSFVTYSQEQGDEIRTLSRWVESEGNITKTPHSAFSQMTGLSTAFDYYCPEKDLLEAFTRREPDKQKIFDKTTREALKQNQATEEFLKELVSKTKTRSDDRAKRNEAFIEQACQEESSEDDPENHFRFFMAKEAFVHSGLTEPLTEQNVAILGRFFGFYLHQLEKTVGENNLPGLDAVHFLNDTTGDAQRKTVLAVVQQTGVRIMEDALRKLALSRDTELLKLFASVAPILCDEDMREMANMVFDKKLEIAYAPLWHVFNKPIFWKTFRDHRNDGLTEK